MASSTACCSQDNHCTAGVMFWAAVVAGGVWVCLLLLVLPQNCPSVHVAATTAAPAADVVQSCYLPLTFPDPV
jgi:hypothetical protein